MVVTCRDNITSAYAQGALAYIRNIRVRQCTWCDNLIPGIVAACHWGVESGKLV